MHRTVKTVEFHRGTISQKTGIDNRVKLAVMAQQARLYERLWGSQGWVKSCAASENSGARNGHANGVIHVESAGKP